MRTFLFILYALFLNNIVPAFSEPMDPLQGATALPDLYAPQDQAQRETGIQMRKRINFDKLTSSVLLQNTWVALAAGDLRTVEAYVMKINDLYAREAQEMQLSLHAYPGNDQIFRYWALNDVGTAWFILGEAYQNAGDIKEASKAYSKVIKEYSYAQCWDPHGWFWIPSEAAEQKLVEISIK